MSLSSIDNNIRVFNIYVRVVGLLERPYFRYETKLNLFERPDSVSKTKFVVSENTILGKT